MTASFHQERFQSNLDRWKLYCPDGAKAVAKIPASGKPEALQKQPLFNSWFSSLNLQNTEALYVVGVGMGEAYLAAQEWLRQDKKRCLVFLESNVVYIRKLFELESGTTLLNDPQVWLFFLIPFPWATHMVHMLCTRFCLLRHQVVVNPLYPPDRSIDLNLLKITFDYYANLCNTTCYEYLHHGRGLFLNYYQNLLYLTRAYQASGLFGRFKNIPAIICGAGPSLNKNVELLATLKDKALIFGGGTAMNALNAKGIIPHFGVGIDPNPDHLTRLATNEAFMTPYFYRNRIFHEALKVIHGDHLWVAGSGGYHISEWVENELHIPTSPPIEEGHNVVNFGLSIAEALGCNPIVFVGVDLSYSDEASYASEITSHPLYQTQSTLRTKTTEENIIPIPDIYGKPVFSLWKWMAESQHITDYTKEHPNTTFINATEGGIGFEGVPNFTLAETAERYFKESRDLDSLVHVAIEQSKMPEFIQTAEITQLLETLKTSLTRCWTDCWEIGKEIKTHIDELLKNEKPSSDIKERQQKLESEPAWKALLSTFNNGFKMYRGRYYERVELDQKLLGETAAALQLEQLEFERYGFLTATAHEHIQLIQKAQSSPDAKFQRFSPPKNIPPPPNRPNDVYFFGSQGNLLSQVGYKNHVRNGNTLWYYASGALYAMMSFLEGKRQGLHEYFYENGTLRAQLPYQNDLLNGSITLYDETGRIRRKLTYKEGKRNGFDRSWNEEGLLIAEAEYAHNKPIGKGNLWYTTGSLAKETLVDEKGHVTIKEWTPQGELITSKEPDYFDLVTIQTQKLSTSLNVVFQYLQEVLATIEAKHDLKEGKELKEQILQLTEQVKNLQYLGNELQKEAGFDPNHPREAIWKSPEARATMEKSLRERALKMQEQVNGIIRVVQLLTKYFLKIEEDKKTKDGK